MYLVCVTNAETHLDVADAKFLSHTGWVALQGEGIGPGAARADQGLAVGEAALTGHEGRGRAPADFVDQLKRVQRDPKVKHAWEEHCRAYGRGIFDPSRHSAD